MTHRFTPQRTVVPELTGTFTDEDINYRAMLHAVGSNSPGLQAEGEFTLTKDMPIAGRDVGGVIPAGTLVRLSVCWPDGRTDRDADITLSFRAPAVRYATPSGTALVFDAEAPQPK